MRIALAVDRFDPQAGGLEQWTVSLARHLLERGHAVHVVAFAEANHALPVTMRLVAPGGGIMHRAARLGAALAGVGADVVHDTGSSWAGDVFQPQAGSRLLSQARLVATEPPGRRLRAMLSPVSIRQRWEMARLERRQLRAARRIIVVSRLVRAQLCARYGVAPAATVLISNGVDTARFTAARLAPLRAAARAALGVGQRVLFLASAHNMRLKGVDTALRAMAPLVASGAALHLAVAGTPADADWQALVARLGLGGHVTFLGPVATMEPLFAAADAMVHATRWDAGSLSTIEAGAAGLPVITTAMNGAAELIADGQTGFVLPDPEDAAALGARMRMLLDPVLRARMGAAARAASVAHDLRDNLAAVEAELVAAARR